MTSVGIMAIASTLPIVALPRITHRPLLRRTLDPRETMPLRTVVWLLAAASSGACVASIEVGALALAVRYHQTPVGALLFTIPLCVASVLGGVWISIRNRRLEQRTVIVAFLLIVVGIATVAFSTWVGGAMIGVVIIGMFVAPLGMSYSLFLEDILPQSRRAEGFALLRTSNSVGVIIASAVIAVGTHTTCLIVSAALACLSAVAIAAGVQHGLGEAR